MKRIATATEVTHVEFSPDGSLIAVGDGRGVAGPVQTYFLTVHESESGAEVVRLPIAVGYQSIAWSSQSNALLTGGPGQLDLFDARSGRRLRTFYDPRVSTGMFGPAGTVLSMNQGGVLVMWDMATGRPLLSASLGGQPEVAVDRTGSLIAKSTVNTGRLFRLEVPSVVRSIPSRSPGAFDNATNHGGAVLDYSRDGRWLVTAVWGAVQLRDAATGEIVATLPVGNRDNHCSARFAADGESLLVASRESGFNRVAIERDGDGWQLVARETIDGEPGFMLADLSPNPSRALLVSMWRNEVKIVSLTGSAPAVRWKQAGAGRAAFVADGREVVANSTDGMGRAPLVIRDAATGSEARALAGLTHGYNVRASADGRWLAVGIAPGTSVLLRTDGSGRGPDLPDEAQGAAKIVAFSHDGEWLAVAAAQRVFLVRLRDGTVAAHLHTAQSGTYAPDIAFSPNDAQLSMIWENGMLTQWDLAALHRELGARRLDW